MEYYAVLFFWHWTEIGSEKPKDSDYILGNIFRTKNHTVALDVYAETPCPASQLVKANSPEGLEEEITKMVENFRDPEWVNNLEKYI